MAAVRLTKRAVILIIFLFLLIGGGTAGYLYWTLQTKEVAPEDSLAAGQAYVGCFSGCQYFNQAVGCNYPAACTEGVAKVNCSCLVTAIGSRITVNYSYAQVFNYIKDAYEAGLIQWCKDTGHVGETEIASCLNEWLQNCGNVVCPETYRVMCCDGTYQFYGETQAAKTAAEACASHGGYENCVVNTGGCTCASYTDNDGCGRACTFTNRTQIEADLLQMSKDNNCKEYIAVCVATPNGTGGWDTVVHYQEYNTSHKCYGKVAPPTGCNNPLGKATCEEPPPVNTCEAGGILLPAASTTYQVGDTITIKGWAADTNGINRSNVVVKVNGVTVGNATTQTACSPDNADSTICTQQGAAKNPIIWTYNYTATTSGTKSFSVTWEDTLGVTGANCQASRSVTVGDVPPTNVCETGGMITPTALAEYEVGDVIHIKGWAADSDGINTAKVAVSVNGTSIGNATVQTACAPDNADATICAQQGASKNPVIWTKDYTVSSAGAKVISVTWEDTLGATGPSCQVSRTVTAELSGNPAWTIDKVGTGVCIDNTPGQQQARLDYTITITNVGDLAGQLVTLVDTLDSKVETSYIQASTIEPDATVNGRVITWNLAGALGLFNPNQTKEFTYSLLIPEADLGQYSNTAVATPETGEPFSATEVVMAACDYTPPEVPDEDETPDTGLFDSIAARVALGLILVGASIMYLSANSRVIDKLSLGISSGVKYVTTPSIRESKRQKAQREKFEKRVAGKR